MDWFGARARSEIYTNYLSGLQKNLVFMFSVVDIETEVELVGFFLNYIITNARLAGLGPATTTAAKCTTRHFLTLSCLIV